MRVRRFLLIVLLLFTGILTGLPLALVRRDAPPQALVAGRPEPGTAPAPASGAGSAARGSGSGAGAGAGRTGTKPPAVGSAAQDGDIPVAVFVNDQKQLLRLPLEEYLKGVVAAEMPAEFESEALKAQAVVARTFAVGRMRVFGGPGCDAHPEADVCTDPARGQAWQPHDVLRRKWGVLRHALYWRKVEQAVDGTRGQIVVFDGQPIDAVYHAASGGRTEDAVAVWGQAVPYLRSVASPYEAALRYEGKRTRFTWGELASRTGVPPEELEARLRRGRPAVDVLARSPSGRALRVRVGEAEFTGRELRARLGLPSTLMTVRSVPGGVEIETRGYGHGVGMSQYGADGLARRGRDYRQIIRYFYPGVQVRRLFEE